MARFDFVFMLTRDDRTVPDAAVHVATALAAGVRHIGFKDVGLSLAALAEVHALIRTGGATSYLEVVSLDRDSEIASARAALALGVDHLLGGTRPQDVAPRLAGSGIRYLPFCGRISGHPSKLEGSVPEIVESARRLVAHDGVHGLDLLAWRSRADAVRLMREVCAAAGKPVIVAGSIDSPDRVAAARGAGAAGFTIGTAALAGRFPALLPIFGPSSRPFRTSRPHNHLNSDGCAPCARSVRARLPFSRPVD